MGEGVHFFDMLRFLAGAEPVRVLSASPRGRGRDEASVVIEFADGSTGSLVYTGSGAAGMGKERLEVFAGGASFVLDDYRSLEVHGLGKEGLKTRTVEKGQKEQLENFYRALRGEASLGRDGRGWAAGHLVRGDGRQGRRRRQRRGSGRLAALSEHEIPRPGGKPRRGQQAPAVETVAPEPGRTGPAS